MQYSIIVATDSQCGIAKDGKIPWNCPADMRHFRETTTGHVVIMGRATMNTLKGPLKDRTNIVLSKSIVEEYNIAFNKDYSSVWRWGCLYCDSIATVDIVCKNISSNKKCFIIGGASIYSQFLELNMVDEVIWTKLSKNYGCDKFFHAQKEYVPYGYSNIIQPGLVLDRFEHIKNLNSTDIPGVIEVWRKK